MPPAARPTSEPSPNGHVEALAAQGVQRRYRRGALLIQEGETGDTLYIVLQGRLRAFLADDQGKELTLGTYGPLEYVGEMSLDGGPRSANVEAARSVALIDVYGRLVRLLNQHAAEPDAEGVRALRERMTHQEMAQHLACSREMVSRLLKDLENGGYIAVRERRVHLLRALPARW